MRKGVAVHCVPRSPKGSMALQCARPAQEPPPAFLSEVFSETAVDGAATGFALAHLRPGAGTVLWVLDRVSRRECGQPYLTGMGLPLDVLRVDVSRAPDVLWAMEQGLGCPSLGAVIGEVWGDPPVLDFTASKRLALRAEAHGVPCWLMRRAASPDLSAARERWRVASLPSGRAPHDARAPGPAHWRVELFRSRFRSPGQWIARYDRTRHEMALEHPLAAHRAPPAKAARA